MIVNLRNNPAKISFGLGVTTKEISTNEQADVWLTSLYDIRFYKVSLISTLVVVEVSDFHYKVSSGVAGTFEIQIKVEGNNKGPIMKSNKIILTVV